MLQNRDLDLFKFLFVAGEVSELLKTLIVRCLQGKPSAAELLSDLFLLHHGHGLDGDLDSEAYDLGITRLAIDI